MKKAVSIFAVLFVFAALVCTLPTAKSSAAEQTDEVYLYNPYRDVDWEKTESYRANIHTHTNNTDGSHPVPVAIRKYADLGYDFLALTDHDKVTYPWEDFGYGDRGEDFDIVDIQGNELSSLHHTVSLFTDFENFLYDDEYDMIAAGVKHQGGAGRFVLAHPGRHTDIHLLDIPDSKYNLEWYTGLYERFDTLLGLEVYNQNDRYDDDRVIYDRILTELMPSRPVWATADDDNHGEHYGYNALHMILPEKSETAFKKALEKGEFFASAFAEYDPAQLDDREGGRYAYMPVVDRVDVDTDAGVISLEARNYTRIEWFTAGGVKAGTGDFINYLDNPFADKYLRAELIREEAGEVICTTLVQPFGIGEYDKNSWYFRFDEKEKSGCASEASAPKAAVVFAGLAVFAAAVIFSKRTSA